MNFSFVDGLLTRKRATGGGARRAAFVAVLAVLALAAAVLGFADDASAQASIFRVGGSVVIRPDEHLVGDVFAVGGTVDVLGSVTGDVVGVGGAVTVDGTVTGDVVALGGSVTLGPDARVFGDVTVVGGMVTRDPQAVVHGEVTSVSVAQTIRSGVNWNIVWWAWPWRDWPLALLYVAGLFAFAALILAWIPDRVHAVERHMETNAGRSAAIGLLALLLLVPLTFVLALTIIGPPLLWIGFLAAKLLGYVALVSFVGRKVAEKFFPNSSALWQLVAGVLLVAVLRHLPVFGWLFTLAVTAWTVGAVLDTKFGSNRPWIPPREA